MQRFILLRGHQGSGKSHFAAQAAAQFQADYPQAEIVHIENDRLLTDAQGNYRWSPAALQAAQQAGEAMMRTACERASAAPLHPILIINANTNQNAAACRRLLAQAAAYGLDCKVYRLENFFPNLHGVAAEDVMAAYLRIRREALDGETALPVVQSMDAEQRELLRQMQNIGQTPLPFDTDRCSYVSDHYLRFGRHNFSSHTSARYPDLRLLNCVPHIERSGRFDAALLEMQGLVMDSRGRIIVRPLPKLLDYRDRLTPHSPFPLYIKDDESIEALVAIDGYQACCTYVEGKHGKHNRRILYSTRSSLDDRRADRLRAHCQAYAPLFRAYPNHSFVFTLADAADRRVILEAPGAYLIGIVETATRRLFTQTQTEALAAAHGIRRPEYRHGITFGELKQSLNTLHRKGFIVFDKQGHTPLCSLQSPHYLAARFIGRIDDTAPLLDNDRHPAIFHSLIEHLLCRREEFERLDTAGKTAYVREFLKFSL